VLEDACYRSFFWLHQSFEVFPRTWFQLDTGRRLLVCRPWRFPQDIHTDC